MRYANGNSARRGASRRYHHWAERPRDAGPSSMLVTPHGLTVSVSGYVRLNGYSVACLRPGAVAGTEIRRSLG